METARKFVELYLDHYFWKLDADEKIAGGLIWFPRESPKLGPTEILDIWIDKNYRRRGLGFKLIAEAIKDMTEYLSKNFSRQKVSIKCACIRNIDSVFITYNYLPSGREETRVRKD